MNGDKPEAPKRLKVAIVAPSLRYVGGQAVQADLLMRLWQNDPEVEVSFIAVDPPLPRALAWAEHVPGLRTVFREPIYFWHLWRGLRDVDASISSPRRTGRFCWRPRPRGGSRSCAARKALLTTAAEKLATTCNAFVRESSCSRG